MRASLLMSSSSIPITTSHEFHPISGEWKQHAFDMLS
jgi:hypothetical protein